MKRIINIENYEEFFIDYLDGNLTEAEIIELEKFLQENEDLREELEGLEKVSIHPEEQKFPLPENLKQIDLTLPVTEENYEFFMIADLEGDITSEQRNALDDYLSENPEKSKDQELYSGTQLKTEGNIFFPSKSKLKKSVFLTYKREIFSYAAVAAGIALLFYVWTVLTDQPAINSFAKYEEESIQEEQVVDTTSSEKNSIPADKPEKSEIKGDTSAPEKIRNAVRNASSRITIKTSIPIAANIPEEIDTLITRSSGVGEDLTIAQTGIDTRLLSNITPLEPVKNDNIKGLTPVRQTVRTQEYLTLQEFAVKKLSDLIFKEEKELNAINIASRGVEKINELAGTNMELEASAKTDADSRVLSFRSGIISFTTPINRED
jgi:hypothetical protein